MIVQTKLVIGAINREDKFNPKFVLQENYLPTAVLNGNEVSEEQAHKLLVKFTEIEPYNPKTRSGWVIIHFSGLHEVNNTVYLIYSTILPYETPLSAGKWHCLKDIHSAELMDKVDKEILLKTGLQT